MSAAPACPDPASLQRFLLGRSNGEEAEALERHLEQCERCLSTLQTLGAEDSVVEAIRDQSGFREPAENATVQSLAGRLKRLRAAPSGEATVAVGPQSSPSTGGLGLEATHDPSPSTPGARPQAVYDFLAPPEQPGELGRLGTYHVLRVLGAGGMGVVFLARDPHLERLVALKAMSPALAASPSAKQRFLREARAAAAIKHDHIVTIYQVGEDRGAPFLAMELLEGEALDERINRENRMPVSEILRIGRETADGLAAAHARGLIHRDVKPGNVWLEGDRGRVKILDFGLVCAAADAAVEESRLDSSADHPGANAVSDDPPAVLTQQGAIVGTPAYMAPEQADGRPVEPRSDLFGLGCVLYRMAAGELPFKGGDAVSTLRAVAVETPPSPHELNPDLPKSLCDLINSLLAKKAEDRPPSARAVAEALEAMERERHVAPLPLPAPSARPPLAGRRDQAIIRPRRRWPLAAVGLALLLLGLAAAAVVFKIQTGSGEIVIETNDPNVEVVTKRGGKDIVIVDPQSKQRWRLDAEKYQLTLADQPEGLTIDLPGQQPFILRRQGEKVATVTRLPVERAEDKADDKVGEVRRFEGHASSVRAVAYSPDGRLALSGCGWPSSGEGIRLWEVRTAKEVRQFDAHFRRRVNCLAFSPNGRGILIGGEESFFRLMDVDTGKEVRKFEGHTQEVYSVAFSPDGRRVLSGNGDGTIRLWDADTGKEIRKFEGHTSWVMSALFFADGKRILSGGADKTLRVWDIETGKELNRFGGRMDSVQGVALSPDNRHALSCAYHENTLRLWDVETGKQVRELAGHKAGVVSVAYSADGRRALSGSLDATLRLWDVETGHELACFQGHDDHVWSVAFSPDGRYALSGSQDHTVRLWRLPDSSH